MAALLFSFECPFPQRLFVFQAWMLDYGILPFLYLLVSLSLSSSCSCSVVSFRTGHYAECVPLQTLISRHYHPGPSQGAFSVSISVWVLVCYLLHLVSCLRPKLQSIYFRHSMLVCVIPYWRNAVAAHLPELSIRVSPHSRSVLLVPLMTKKWPIIN